MNRVIRPSGTFAGRAGEREIIDMEPTDEWPDFDLDQRTDLRGLARYVSTEALEGSGLLLPGSSPSVMTSPDRVGAVQHAYERMATEGRFRYDLDPFTGRAGQRIRSIYDAQRDKATCLDLALVYSAMCLSIGVDHLLLMLKFANKCRHAMVVVLDADHRDGPGGRAHTYFDEGSGVLPGQLKLSQPPDSRPEDPSHVATEFLTRFPVGNGEGGAQYVEVIASCLDRYLAFEEACTRGEDILWRSGPNKITELVAIHVPWLLRETGGGLEPFRPVREGSWRIHQHFPAAPEFRTFPTRRGLVETLASERGTLVINGDTGSGKSLLAREVGLEFGDGHGYGWFLRADDPTTVVGSLALAEADEQGLGTFAVDRIDRSALSVDAITRLGRIRGPWVVIADNAESEDMASLLKELPTPGPDQLLIVTTTNRAWEQQVDLLEEQGRPCRFVQLEALPSADLELVFGVTEDEIGLSAGRPLYASAFAQLRAVSGASVTEPPAAEHDGSPEQRAASALWAYAREHLSSRKPAELAAMLPPEHVDHALLADLTPGVEHDPGGRLLDLGVLRFISPGISFLHRSIGRAIRRSEVDLAETSVVWLALERVVQLHDEYGAAADLLELRDLIADLSGSSAGLGKANVARLLEVFGMTGDSARLYEAARTDLVGTEPAHQRPLAEALHGEFRRTNQLASASQEEIARAIAGMEQVIELRREHADRLAATASTEGERDAADLAAAEVEASTALRLLLEAKQAEVAGDLEASVDVLAGLEASATRRGDLIGREHLLTIRGKFNVAPQTMRVAKLRGEGWLFGDAERLYEEVKVLRQRLHRRPAHPHVAACDHGVALVRFNLSLYGTTDPVERAGHLDVAFARACEALHARQQVPRGRGLDDLKKSWDLLEKTSAVQRWLLDGNAERLERVLPPEEFRCLVPESGPPEGA
jgi:hypothetical protein